ncbi:MAG TPA: aminopeptidase [archaeon]|nr:aminopeptidase [archaeon]
MVSSVYIKIAKVLKNSLHVKGKDRVLVVTDETMEKIAGKFYHVVKALAPASQILKIKPTGQHGREPPLLLSMMKGYDVIIYLTKFSLTHTETTKAAVRSGKRVASMPGFTEEMFAALDVDYEKMRADAMKLKKLLERTSEVKVTTSSGTDVKFSLGLKVTPSFADASEGVINLPDGEVFLPPQNMNGVVVFDSADGIDEQTKIVIKDNVIFEFEDSNSGKKLESILSGKNASYVAEFGIGINPKAKVIGNVLQDEKVLGTCHIAFGNNTGFGGTNKADVHIDVIINEPTITLDGKEIMSDGVKKW